MSSIKGMFFICQSITVLNDQSNLTKHGTHAYICHQTCYLSYHSMIPSWSSVEMCDQLDMDASGELSFLDKKHTHKKHVPLLSHISSFGWMQQIVKDKY